MRIISIKDMSILLQNIGLENFISQLIAALRTDFSRWTEYQKCPRHVTPVKDGVIELMPIADNTHYACKYVNGHPKNPQKQQLCVVALGLLADIASGYPLLISEMTLLTAIRTAATAALATDLMANPNADSLAIIGCGAQAEFQCIATSLVRPIHTIFYYDIDPQAMNKLASNIRHRLDCELIACKDVESAISTAKIITTCTANKCIAKIVDNRWIHPGQHINGLGGDCSGKVELDPNLLKRARIAVEYKAQSMHEGDIQQLSDHHHCVELHEIIQDSQKGRQSSTDITLFDSVGFALEDYTALTLLYDIAQQLDIGQKMAMLPHLKDPKDLFSLLNITPS